MAGAGRAKMSKKQRTRAATRTRGTRVLAQGAGALPTRPFGNGSRRVKKKNMKRGCDSLLNGLNARLPMHLGLPRPVGPYTVIRTSTIHTSSARVLIFSPFCSNGSNTSDAPLWYAMCGVEDVSSSDAINASTNTAAIPMPIESLGIAAEVAPAALTVQVMNQTALNEANGLFAMGRVNQQLALGDSARTYDTFKDQFISYYKPRLLSGGKLALRGVTCNAYPLNMSEFSNFAPLSPKATPFTWSSNIVPAALSPIVFVQETPTPVNVSFLITIEWRCRFDPLNPATSSHTMHPITPDSSWNEIISRMSAAGHGVADIADEVAEVGASVGAARAAWAFAL